MNMLPIFMIGFCVGVWVTALYHAYKKETPSEVRINTLEHYIECLKNDISSLENENKALKEELKRAAKIGG